MIELQAKKAWDFFPVHRVCCTYNTIYNIACVVRTSSGGSKLLEREGRHARPRTKKQVFFKFFSQIFLQFGV